LNKGNLEGCYFYDLMQILSLDIIFLMHFCQEPFPDMPVVFYPQIQLGLSETDGTIIFASL